MSTLEPQTKPTITPYEYQENFVESLEPTFMFEGDGDYFVNSCVSSGKSMMMAMAANKLEGRVVLLISISSLLEQIEWHLNLFDEPFSVLKAGHDEKFDPTKRIQLIMAQTLHARLDKVSLTARYILQDEGHREFMSARTTAIINKLRPDSRLLFSGTCYDSQGFQFEGTRGTFETIQMQTLIDEGKLSKVKYFTPKWSNIIDYDNVKLTSGEYNTASLEEIINSDGHMQKVLASMNHMDAKNKKTLVFCSSIEQCEIVTKALKADGYYAEQVHSKVNKKDNEAILNAFRNNELFAGHMSERQGQSLFTVEEKITRPINCLVSVNQLGIGYSVSDIRLAVILRPTKIRSLAEQIEGRVYRFHPDKEYGEILDLAQIIKNFGFVHEGYKAPKRTGSRQKDKILIDEINKQYALEKIEVLTDDMLIPVEITRDLYNDKLKEIEEKEIEFIRNRKAFQAKITKTANEKSKANNKPIDPIMQYAKELGFIINTTNNFYSLVAAGAEFWMLMNGKPVSKAGKTYSFDPDWLCENLEPHLQRYPEKSTHWLKAYRTRVKNLCKQGKNYNGIKFFIDYLVEQHELELEQEQDIPQYQQQYNTSSYSSSNNLPEIDINDDEIPF